MGQSGFLKAQDWGSSFSEPAEEVEETPFEVLADGIKY